MMKRMAGMVGMVVLAGVYGVVMGEAPASAPGVDAEAHRVLVELQGRKGTLKDFVGKVDYAVESAVTGDVTGKRGTVAVVVDPVKGTLFTVDFTVRTVDGKAKALQHQQIIFDGTDLTVKDFEPKQYVKTPVAPGSSGALSGPVTVPIGLDPAEVEKEFVVTSVASKDAGKKTIRLVPRDAKKFDFRSMEVTVDEGEVLPVKLMQVGKNEDVTTIEITDIEVNKGKAKMESAAVPGDWTVRK